VVGRLGGGLCRRLEGGYGIGREKRASPTVRMQKSQNACWPNKIRSRTRYVRYVRYVSEYCVLGIGVLGMSMSMSIE
jgi:hypothetical protein